MAQGKQCVEERCFLFAIGCKSVAFSGVSISHAIGEVCSVIKCLPEIFNVGSIGILLLYEDVVKSLLPIQDPSVNTRSVHQAIREITRAQTYSSEVFESQFRQVASIIQKYVNNRERTRKCRVAVTLVYFGSSDGSEVLDIAVEGVALPIEHFVNIYWSNSDLLAKRVDLLENQFRYDKYTFSNEAELCCILKNLMIHLHDTKLSTRIVVPSRTSPISCSLSATVLPINSLLKRGFGSLESQFFRTSLSFEGQSQNRYSKQLNVKLTAVASMDKKMLSVDVMYDYPMRLTADTNEENDAFSELVNLIESQSMVLICRFLQPASELQPFVAVFLGSPGKNYLTLRRLVISDFFIPDFLSTSNSQIYPFTDFSKILNSIREVPDKQEVASLLKSNIFQVSF